MARRNGNSQPLRVNFDINFAYVPHLTNYSRTQIYYGGSASGKSVFVAQRGIIDLLQGGRNYLIVRAVARTIRGSVFTQIDRLIKEKGLSSEFKVNKTDMLITCKNGYQAIFAGLDDVEKLKSIVPAKGSITDIWIEEATEVERDSVKQLIRRQRGGDEGVPKRMTLTFNPILQTHWIYEDYFNPIAWRDDQTEYKDGQLSILKTWYIHNRFLTQDDVRDLTSEKDKYWRDVYTFGRWGILGHLIFTNWRTEDLSGMRDQFTNRFNGLDFGFSSDPAALPATHYDKMHKTIYIFDELYQTGLTNDLLADEMRAIIGDDDVVGDSAEPKSIVELRQHGINIRPAVKGKDSVLHGIQWLQQQTIIVDRSCVNMRNELQQYHWEEDKYGHALRRPIDKNNHLIDALRYAYEKESRGLPQKATSRQG